MRHVSFAIASLYMLLVVPQMTRADLIYNIQNYPSDQNGHTLSGTITTDGTIGTLTASNIVSWVVTFDGTDTFRSTDPGGKIAYYLTDLVANSVNLTVGTGADLGLFVLPPNPSNLTAGVQWSNSGPDSTVDYYSAQYSTPITNILWEDSMHNPPPSFGGTNPWVIGIAQSTAVPEPSTFVGAGLVVVCGIAYGLARKRRAQRKPRNEP